MTSDTRFQDSLVEREIAFHLAEFFENRGFGYSLSFAGPVSKYWESVRIGLYVQLVVDDGELLVEASNPGAFECMDYPRWMHERLSELGFVENSNYQQRFELPDLGDRGEVDQFVASMARLLAQVMIEVFECPPDYKLDIVSTG